ncbi:hypothetical protein [Sulfitobacter sp.]|uniref:hypothetical protein n=1 Tax=Sulfitobacter sp. TaxID=1903071 RepID=UPI0030036CC5
MGIGALLSLSGLGGIGAGVASAYSAIGAAALRFAGSVLLSRVAASFASTPKQQDLKRDLTFPTSRPSYRYPYGRFLVSGTPLPYPVVGEYAYACWLISSRPSDGGFTLYIDNREVELTGDPYDFTLTGGATATEYPFKDHATFWIGLGDQTQPPQVFLDEAGYIDDSDELKWKASDIGTGCTFVWAKLKAGDNGKRSERWPSAVPSLEPEGRFSLVYDPREAAHDADDPDTWEWSENAGLCALDLWRQNPFRPYELRNLAMPMWDVCADVSAEAVSLNSGGTEPRYATSGVVVFDGSELEQLVQPLLACMGARLTRSGGQLGAVPAAPRTTAVTITDSLEGFAYSALLEDASLVTDLRVNYSPFARGGEPAELTPWAIPGALDADGGQPSVKTLDLSMVSSATQAQRLRNIFGKISRLQRAVSFVAPPSAIKAVSGSVVDLGVIPPYGTYANGLYEVQDIGAAVHMVSDDGVAMRCPVALQEYSDAVFDWNPATDEEEVVHVDYDSQRDGVAKPGALSVTSGDGIDQNTGGAFVPRFLFQFDPSTSSSVEQYEWQWRLTDGDYETGGYVSAETLNDADKVFFYLNIAAIAGGHDVRVRSISSSGRSDWTELTGAFYSFDIVGTTAVSEPGRVLFAGTGPSSMAFSGLQAFRADVGAGFDAAERLGQVVDAVPGEAFDIIVGDADAVNLLANGDFADTSAWTLDAGGWSIAGGTASHTAGVLSWLEQTVSDVAEGTSIRFTFDVIGRTAGGVGMRATGDTNMQRQTTSNGTFSDFVTTPANTVKISFYAGSTFDGDIDNAFAVVSTPNTVPLGEADFWLVPVTVSGAEGTPVGPFTLQIP